MPPTLRRARVGQLSIALLSFAAGAITGMQAIGRLVDRYGSTRLMIRVAAGRTIAAVGRKSRLPDPVRWGHAS